MDFTLPDLRISFSMMRFKRKTLEVVAFGAVAFIFLTIIFTNRSKLIYGVKDVRYSSLVELQSTNYTSVHNMGRHFQVKNLEFEDDKEIILLVSSLGRSGSSWVGELLSLINNDTLYVYEPMIMISKLYNERNTDSLMLQIVKNVMNCQMEQDVMILTKMWTRVLRKFREKCPNRCKTINEVNKHCLKSKTLVVKTIRLHLSEVEDLLNKKSFQHIKVVYLTRDPRAQIVSRIRTFTMSSRTASDLDYMTDCQRVNADVFSFHRLSRMFPGHFYMMRYEDMCRDPIGQSTMLWRFLRTDPSVEIPDTWYDFLSNHSVKLTIPQGPKQILYSIFRNTSTEWYKWRSDVNEMTNVTINVRLAERECSVAMDVLGYRRLWHINNIKNLTIPFLTDMDCDFLNCWSFQYRQ